MPKANRVNITPPTDASAIKSSQPALRALTSAPHLKFGEFAVIDTTDNDPQKGEIYIIQYGGPNRNRRIVQTRSHIAHILERGRPRPRQCWWVGDLAGFRRTGEMFDGIIPMFSGLSDGPYLAQDLKPKLLGRVVGYAVTSLGGLLASSAEYDDEDRRIQVTAVRKPLKGCAQWSGAASNEVSNFEWFYEPRGRFAMRRQEPSSPNCWMYCEPPEGARRAVVKAVRAARAV
jgi:hypothetical protein